MKIAINNETTSEDYYFFAGEMHHECKTKPHKTRQIKCNVCGTYIGPDDDSDYDEWVANEAISNNSEDYHYSNDY